MCRGSKAAPLGSPGWKRGNSRPERGVAMKAKLEASGFGRGLTPGAALCWLPKGGAVWLAGFMRARVLGSKWP